MNPSQPSPSWPKLAAFSAVLVAFIWRRSTPEVDLVSVAVVCVAALLWLDAWAASGAGDEWAKTGEALKKIFSPAVLPTYVILITLLLAAPALFPKPASLNAALLPSGPPARPSYPTAVFKPNPESGTAATGSTAPGSSSRNAKINQPALRSQTPPLSSNGLATAPRGSPQKAQVAGGPAASVAKTGTPVAGASPTPAPTKPAGVPSAPPAPGPAPAAPPASGPAPAAAVSNGKP